MTSGLKSKLERAGAAGAACAGFRAMSRRLGWALSLAAIATSASALDMNELMPLLAAKRSGEARFIEQRFVSGFEQPLESTGTLSFTAPDRFTRTTTTPRAEQVKVEGNNVTLVRGGRSRQMALDAAPEMTAIVEALRGTLTGDAATLRKYFHTELTGTRPQWELKLLPQDERLASRVRWLRIEGVQGEVRRVEVQMPDGDRSTMAITPL